MHERLRIVVSGMIAGDPHQGGNTWAVMQYVLGLRAMGHDVYLVEPVTAAKLRPEGSAFASSVNAGYFTDIVRTFDLSGRAALVRAGSRETVGVAYDSLREALRSADVLINISGMLTDHELIGRLPRRVYVDVDPAFTQLWHQVQGLDVRFDGHTHFATVGLALGTADCAVPTCGKTWLPTLPPVVLSRWPMRAPRPDAFWTTVGHWRGYGSVDHEGVLYGQKAHSVRRLLDLPGRTRARLQPALAIHPGEVKDVQALAAAGWDYIDPLPVSSTPDLYQAFVEQSKGELGIAKSGYVASRCGWFSDRSVCYLASGRPVVAQDTGFSRVLPVGEGLLTFGTTEEAAGALDRVECAYTAHCARARDFAEAYLGAERVLGSLLERVGASPGDAGAHAAPVGAREAR